LEPACKPGERRAHGLRGAAGQQPIVLVLELVLVLGRSERQFEDEDDDEDEYDVN